jgi:hypothetical protein
MRALIITFSCLGLVLLLTSFVRGPIPGVLSSASVSPTELTLAADHSGLLNTPTLTEVVCPVPKCELPHTAA